MILHGNVLKLKVWEHSLISATRLLNGHYVIPIYTLILLPSNSNCTFRSSVALRDAVRHWDNWIWGATAISRVLQNDWHMISWQRTNRQRQPFHTLLKWCQNGSNFARSSNFHKMWRKRSVFLPEFWKIRIMYHTFKSPKSSQIFRRFTVYLKTRMAC